MSKIKYLFISRCLSEFAGAILPVVFPLFILKTTHSLSLSGLFFTITMLPSVLLTPAMGVWIEKYEKKKVTFFSVLTLAILCSIESMLLKFGRYDFIYLVCFAILVSIFSMMLDLSSKVLFTELVDESELEKYNGIRSILDNLSVFGAPMLGTLVYGVFGFSSVILILAILYVLAAVVIAFIPLESKNGGNDQIVEESFVQKFRIGLHFIRTEKAILKYFLLIMALNFFVASSEEVTNPGIAIQKYHIPTSIFGLVSIAFSIGVILSGIFIAKNSKIEFRKHISKLFVLNSLVMVLIGFSSVFLISFNAFVFFGLMLFFEVLLGFITILVNVPMTSFFQSQVPLNIQSRFFALLSFSANLIVPLGILYTGFLASAIGADVTYIINNILVIVIVCFAFWKEIGRGFRAFLLKKWKMSK